MEIFKGRKQELDLKAAELVRDSLKDAAKKRTHVVFGISGRNDLVGVFDKLKEMDIDWTFVEIFMTDENFVSWDDENSNYGMVKKRLIDELVSEGKLPVRNVHAFDKSERVRDYEAEFVAAGGMFDVVLLGFDREGSVASLFAGGKGLVEDENFVEMKDAPITPKKRMTITRRTLEKSGVAVLVVQGLDKKEDYENFLKDGGKVEDCPAKLLKNVEELYVLTDLD